MKRSFQMTVHYFIGIAVVLHAAGLCLALWILFPAEDALNLWVRLWVGLVTLWFLWPIVLSVTAVKSVRRAFVPLALAAPFVLICGPWYSRFTGPRVFGMPWGVHLTPYDLVEYAASYVSGWTYAMEERRSGNFVLEGYGFGFGTPHAPSFSREAREQYGIELEAVATCVVNTWIIGHVDGCNNATRSALRHRYSQMVSEAEEEDERKRQSYLEGEKAGQQEAISDTRAGGLAIEVSNPSMEDADFERMLREQYGIGLRRTYPDADSKLTDNVLGHRNGYNGIADSVLRRRFRKSGEQMWREWERSLNPPP